MTSVVIDLIRSFEGGLNVIDLEILNNVLNSNYFDNFFTTKTVYGFKYLIQCFGK